MWFFMYSCYLLSVMTFVMLLIGFAQSFLKFSIFNANHLIFMILTSIIYAFAETLVIFFFVGTGISVKEYMLKHKITADYHKRSIAIKRKIYPPLLLNMLLMIVLFCLVGAVDTNRVAPWIYQLLFVWCIVDYARIKVGQNTYFSQMTNIILEMASSSSK